MELSDADEVKESKTIGRSKKDVRERPGKITFNMVRSCQEVLMQTRKPANNNEVSKVRVRADKPREEEK